MKIATWNVNGIKARLDSLVDWLARSRPDIACLQEIKCVDEAFPREAVEAAGYRVETHGQKGFNGVALLSRVAPDEIGRGLPPLAPGDEPDPQARLMEGIYSVSGGALRVASLYLPNGNPVDGDKFPYKLRWMRRLERWASERLALEEPLVLAGDYNVIPEPADCHDPAAWRGDALFRDETRSAFRRLKNLGFTDAVRATTDAADAYTFWDYKGGAWQRNRGIRIDHLLLSPEAANRLCATDIETWTRGWEKPSDHVPVVAELDFEFVSPAKAA